MGGYDPESYDDVSNFLTFPNDSDEEDETMASTPTPVPGGEQNDTAMLTPPASANEEDLIDEELDEDDLYAASNEALWKARRNSSVSGALDSPVNPQWLLSNDPPPKSKAPESQQTSSEDVKTPTEKRAVLQTIHERKDQLVKTGTGPKTSKSFPLLPDLLNMKQPEDEDEKILASEEGKKLGPKERRQLRNKVSARNFRVRRKGMSTLFASNLKQNISVT